jgi:hypothetical protein
LDDGCLIEGQPQNREVGTLLLRESWTHTGAIQVLDPKQKSASRRPGEQPGKDGGAEIANMELACRARCVSPGAVHGNYLRIAGNSWFGLVAFLRQVRRTTKAADA